MLDQRRFDSGIFLKLYQVWDILIARRKRPITSHIDPAPIALVQAKRLDTLFDLPIQTCEICLENLQITVAAQVAEGNGTLVEDGLKFLR